MKYIYSFYYKSANYALIAAQFLNVLVCQIVRAETPVSSDVHFTVSGIDGTDQYKETVCPGFNLCFDIFSFGGNQTQKAEMFWDHAIPTAAFLVSNEDMPTG